MPQRGIHSVTVPGAVHGWVTLLNAYGTIQKLASSADHIIPGHDPLVLQRYPVARPGLENVIVRLDVDPAK